MDTIDKKIMWETLIRVNDFDQQDEYGKRINKDGYDPKSVLKVFLHLLRPGSDLSCREFITSNALSFCLAATSLYSEGHRIMAYAALQCFKQKLKELSDEKFNERIIYTIILTVFQNSIESPNQRMSHIISHFFARVCKLALVPEDPVFSPITTFFALKPAMRSDTVPEFLKLFFSTSTENHLKERQWVLRLCSEAILDSYDYSIISKIYVVEYCMAIFTSTMADYWTKLLILKIFKRCSDIHSGAKDMFLRINFTVWLAQAIGHYRTTVFEMFELTSIFIRMVEHICDSLKVKSVTENEDASSDETQPLASTDRKAVRLQERKPLLMTIARLSGEKISKHLKNDERIVEPADLRKRKKYVKNISQLKVFE